MTVKENDYTCGTCKYGAYCANSEPIGTCGDWTDPDEIELTDEEKLGIIGDRKAHEIMEEGREIG